MTFSFCTGLKKEPPYNKLSVRESLASMNARAASNTYEYVSEVDNLYATVCPSSLYLLSYNCIYFILLRNQLYILIVSSNDSFILNRIQ